MVDTHYYFGTVGINSNCKPYIVRHSLGGKTEYRKFDSHHDYHNWMEQNKDKTNGFQYYEYCHKNEFFNKMRIYCDKLKFPFSFPKEIK
jgi:hypothetical protein